MWIGQLPDSYVDSELQLSKLFARFGKVLTCTIQAKPGDRKNWALLTFVHPSAVNDCVAAGLSGEIAVEDDEQGRCVLVVRKAKVDTELRREDTGALSKIWELQNNKIGKAVLIQKTVRGHLTRQRSMKATKGISAVTAFSGSSKQATQLMCSGSLTNPAVWPPEVTKVVITQSDALSGYLRWLRTEPEASSQIVLQREEILADVRKAMMAPSKPQLIGAVGVFFVQMVLCVVLLGMLMGSASELQEKTAETEAAAATPVVVASGAGLCLDSTITNAAGVQLSVTDTLIGAAFTLTVTVCSRDAIACTGNAAVNRVLFADFASEFSKLVTCVPSTTFAAAPAELPTEKRPPAQEGVAYSYHTSACAVAASDLPLGRYDVQLVYAATIAAGANPGGSLPHQRPHRPQEATAVCAREL